jgi:type IV pilus assembly protein PilC
MKFNYQARTKEGETQAGQIEASSKEAAISLLQKYQLYVTDLEEIKSGPIYAKEIKFFKRISRKDIVLFSRQLSILFKSKVLLVEALAVISSQTKNPDFREKILKLSEEVEGGTPFSQALSRYPKIFSSFYVSMIKSGEVSGKLSESLSYLADHLEREYHLTNRMKGATIYPALVLFIVIGVLLLMIFFVIPQLTEVLEESGQELPLITELVISFSTFLRKFGWILILVIVGSLIFSFRYYQTVEGKKLFEKVLLKIPVVGAFLKMVYLSRFAENLSTLISGGLPISRSLEITGEVVGNTIYKEIILKAKDEVRKGESISSVLRKFPEFFPPVFTQMTTVGEKTGTLDTTLISIVDFYQEEVDRGIDNILNLLEPVLIIFLGLVVGGIVASILLPLYQGISF